MNTKLKKGLFYGMFLLFFNVYSAQDYSVTNINNNLLNNSSAIIRNEETSTVIHSQKKMNITKKKAVTVLNKSKDDFSLFYFPYNPQFKIKSLQAIVYDKDGKKVRTLKKSEFQDISTSDGFSLYTDYRALFYKYYPLSYPYTVEYIVEAESSNTIFLADYAPLSISGVAVENSSYKISNLSGIELRKKMYSSQLFQIHEKKTETGWEYSVSSLYPLISEPLSPSFDILTPKVSFALSEFYLAGKEGAFSDWNELGKWMYSDLLEPTQKLPDKARTEIQALIKNEKDEREKIRILYQYMQDKTRYVNVTIGIGGWKPMDASEVYSKGYGDCKALTNYMFSILKEAGIPAYYTIINSGESEEDFDSDFPKMGGNHVILNIPTKNDTIWLENTSQIMAFNQLGSSTANKNAIAISSEGAKIVETKKYNSDANTEDVHLSIKLLENGDAILRGSMLYKGLQYSSNLGLLGADSKKIKDIYKENFSNLSIINFNTCKVNNDRNEEIISTDLDFKVLKYSTHLGNNLFFNAVPVNRMRLGIQEDTNRILPLEINFGYRDVYTFHFTSPDGYSVESLPENILKISEFGIYSMVFIKEEEGIKILRTLQINKGVYPKEKFNEYVKFRNSIVKFDNIKINLTKKL